MLSNILCILDLQQVIYLHTLSRTNIGGSYQTEHQNFSKQVRVEVKSTTILLIVCHLALSDKTKKRTVRVE